MSEYIDYTKNAFRKENMYKFAKKRKKKKNDRQ